MISSLAHLIGPNTKFKTKYLNIEDMISSNQAKDVRGGGFEPGVRENFWIKHIEVEKKGSWAPCMEVVFENADGGINRSNYWAPTMAPWMRGEKDLKKAEARKVKLIMEIVDMYRPEIMKEINGSDWMDFFNKCRETVMYSDAYKNKVKLRGIFVYDGKGFLKLRQAYQANNIQRMNIGENNIFKRDGDIFTKPTPPVTPISDDFRPQVESLDPSINDLPF